MLTLSLIFILIASSLYLIGFIPYIYHVFHGRVVPHPFSWTVWFLFAIQSGYLVYLKEGMSLSLIPIGVRTIALCIGAILGWFYFRRIATRTVDYVALILAIITIGISQLLGSSQTMILMITIDFLVLFPTLRKIWVNPASEDPLAWIMAGCFHFFMILSLQIKDFSTTGYFVYNVLLNFLVALLIYRRVEYMRGFQYFFKKLHNMFALKKKLW